MKRLFVAMIAATCAFVLPAAEHAPGVEEPEVAGILDGQRKFLAASIAMCEEKVPALKRDLSAARGHADSVLRKAESVIRDETADNRKKMRSFLESYAARWVKLADDLMVALRRQNAEAACPTLVSSWTSTEAEIVVEDWHNFLAQQGPDSEAAVPQAGAGGK